jgi:hypothetical protein
LISFGQAKVNLASVVHPDADHAKWCIETGYVNTRRYFRDNLTVSQPSEMGASIPRSYPQTHGTIGSSLQEEHRIIQSGIVYSLMRYLPAREFRNLSDNSSIEHSFWSSLRHIAENAGLARQPGIGPPLNIMGDKLMKEYEYDHGAAGERQRGPKRDAPSSTAHRFNGL